jgi:hypothetical protein
MDVQLCKCGRKLGWWTVDFAAQDLDRNSVALFRFLLMMRLLFFFLSFFLSFFFLFLQRKYETILLFSGGFISPTLQTPFQSVYRYMACFLVPKPGL